MRSVLKHSLMTSLKRITMTDSSAVNHKASKTEAWLRGPLQDISFMLTPAAHALMQGPLDIERAASDLTAEEVWSRQGGAPSVGFHLRHIAGSIDRLLTYEATNAGGGAGHRLALSLKARIAQGKRDHRTYGEWFCAYSTIQ